MSEGTDGEHIAERVRVAREALHLSKAELARRAGVSRVYVTELEQGRYKQPRWASLDRVARALGLKDANQLLGDATPEELTRQAVEGASLASIEQYIRAGKALLKLVELDPEDAAWKDIAGDFLAVNQFVPALLEELEVGQGQSELAEKARFVLRDYAEAARSAENLSEGASQGVSVQPSRQRNAQGPIVGATPLLRVYRMDARGDPREPAKRPMLDHYEPPPHNRQQLIGPRGFGVLVTDPNRVAIETDDTEFKVGDVLWANPDASDSGLPVLLLTHVWYDDGRDDGFWLMRTDDMMMFVLERGIADPANPLPPVKDRIRSVPELQTRLDAFSQRRDPSRHDDVIAAVVCISRQLPTDAWLALDTPRDRGTPTLFIARDGGLEPAPAEAQAAVEREHAEFEQWRRQRDPQG